MAHGDSGVHEPSCATAPLGKSVRCALRIAMGIPKKNKKKKPQPSPSQQQPCRRSSVNVSMELSSSSLVAVRKEAVVRVVLRGGVVEEVYPGVVLACTVIRNHPPGLCLAHPDVFRNPHGAVVRPLFPGQKFLLLPESTVIRLKQKIPESSIGAFTDDEEYDDVEEEEEEELTTSEGGGALSSKEEAATAGDSTTTLPACSARDYFEANDRWSEYRFGRLMERGLAVALSKDDDDEEPAKRRKQENTRRTTKKKRRKGPWWGGRGSLLPQLPMELRWFATTRRTWEPACRRWRRRRTPSPSSPSLLATLRRRSRRRPNINHEQQSVS